MRPKSLFSDMLQTIAERGRRFLSFGAREKALDPLALIETRCETLLSSRGEASGMALAKDILERWHTFDEAAQRAFMHVLLTRFGPDTARLDAAIDAWRANGQAQHLLRLHAAAEPRRQELIRRLNLAPGGTAALVRMREVLLRCKEDDHDLVVVDADFAHLFSSWFNRGFLTLRPINWSTPADILEKIIRYEAVHHISGWDELRRRLAPQDRRCFAFFHPQLPDEPLIFVEVALTRDIPARIDAILREDRTPLRADEATTAVFYSISNCQTGLRGVSFGNFLIKQVVEDLRRDLPTLNTFVTLSPVPGFAAWLRRARQADAPEGLENAHKTALAALDTEYWAQDENLVRTIEPVLTAAAAGYFLQARDAKGRIIDPVARFHLGNGARLERINFLADRSNRALRQAHGLMVNYLYKLEDIEANHEAFASRNEVATTPAIRRLIPTKRRGRKQAAIKPRSSSVHTGNHLFDAIRNVSAPQALFIETAAGKRWTYADMLAFSGRMAAALVALGVTPGDRVAAQVEKSPEALMLYLACLRAGAVYLPLNTGYTLAELDYFIGDAEPRLVVCAPDAAKDMIALAQRHKARVETLDAQGNGSLMTLAQQQASDFVDVARTADDLAAILYTSGTTGRPKGAMLTHENLRSNAQALRDTWHYNRDDKLIHALPIFHTHGLFVATNVTLFSGASILLLPKFDVDAVLKHMRHATVLMGVPTFYVRLAQHPGLTRETVAAMRLFISGSAPLLAETHRDFAEKTGHAILERYGMSETNMNTSNPYVGERIAGTVGFPLPGVSLRVTDLTSGKPLAQGETGMIEVKGPNVFKGYWRMPEKTAAEFRDDGFFITGDLGRIDARGYVHIVGRGKDLVISGGYNIYPKEVETEIDAMDGVEESAVIGVPHPDFGEGVTAVVVRAPGAAIDEPAVLTGLKDRLARYKQPKRVLFVEELPRNTMGKVQKNVLRAQYAELYR